MLFNSIEFLFVFLPLVVVGFLLLQKLGSLRLIILWLVGCSLFFYAWWNPAYLILLLLSVCVNYSIGLVLGRHEKGEGRVWLVLGVLFNLGLLGYFKYANFFIENIRLAVDWSFHFEFIILPLAISFYTFQQITYLVDTHKKMTGPHGFLEYCLFVCFFPQLIAGPIVHHGEMFSQFGRLTDRSGTYTNLTIGLSIFTIGLFKKVVLADSFAGFSTPVFNLAEQGVALSTLDALSGIFSYAFQLYFDFSGYSDMAIALACLFGLKLPVNFFSPYRAQNISDFWRMWHATLSRFLRDYVYASLGGFFCSPNRQRFNLFTTMFVGGVWHGAGWTFVVYGLCHGAYVVIHQLWRTKVSGPLGLVGRRDYKAAAQVFTFLVVALTLLVFRAETMTSASHIFAALFQWNGFTFAPQYVIELKKSGILEFVYLLTEKNYHVGTIIACLVLALTACWILPSTYQLFRTRGVAIDKPMAGREAVLSFEWQPSKAWAAYFGLLALLSILNISQVSEFLYFQF